MPVHTLRRLLLILALAIVPVGTAGAASAHALVCVALDHGVPVKPLLQLVATPVGDGFVSIVGRRTHPTAGDRGVVSGGGVTTNGVLEVTLQSTTIVTIAVR